MERHKLLLYLEAHNLSVKDFLSVIKGEKLPRFVFAYLYQCKCICVVVFVYSHNLSIKVACFRIFIPFRKDEMKGTVVQLDRGSKSRGDL